MNIAEVLAHEIRRVATLRERVRALNGSVQVAQTALLIMDAALDRACKAAGLDDVVAQIAAGQELERFQE